LARLDVAGTVNAWKAARAGALGGMQVASGPGVGEQTIVQALGLGPLGASRILLVGARDLGPGERFKLSRAGVSRAAVEDVPAMAPPEGPLYVHLDLDVVTTDEMPAVNYPAAGGPSAAAARLSLDHPFAPWRGGPRSVPR